MDKDKIRFIDVIPNFNIKLSLSMMCSENNQDYMIISVEGQTISLLLITDSIKKKMHLLSSILSTSMLTVK